MPEPPGSTGGVDGGDTACGRGVVVLSTDYQSTNLSLMAPSGEVRSGSFISSASRGVGLSAPLSGDVALPSEAVSGAHLVLIDRYPASVLTWVELTTGRVRAQLNVGTGFAANPHDYVEVSEELAYVTRFEPNSSSGLQPFDAGSDLLILDPRGPSITGRIDLSALIPVGLEGYHPRPDKLLRVGSQLYLLASAYSLDFRQSLPSRIARIDIATNTVQAVLELTGLHGCAGMDLSPNQTRLAVGCSGPFDSGAQVPVESGLALVRLTPELELERALFARDLVPDPTAYALSFASDEALVFTTFGRFPTESDARPDRLYELDLSTLEAVPLLESEGDPFTLRDVRCFTSTAPGEGCGACFVADAGRGVVHRYPIGDGQPRLAAPTPIRVDTRIGLPPSALGGF
ncbi:MAG: hypothetical protein KIT72_02995 [Polyangiaceae bacterium]|nr:hypothetical protein [Polyangiaceae bacterium]